MSFLIAAPEMVAAAATDLARVGSTLSAGNAADIVGDRGRRRRGIGEHRRVVWRARPGVSGAERAGGDVSQPICAGPHRGANSYAGAEAANASPLQAVQQDVLHAVNAPSQALTGVR
jgi:hypothetical protein